MWLHQGPEFFLYVEELLPNKPTVADPHWKLKKTSVQSHILINNDYVTDDLRKQLQNLHAFRTTFNTKLWRWKLGVFFLRVTPLWFVFSFITISNGVHLSGQDECVTYSYIWEGQTGYVTAALQLFISGMNKVSVMPLHEIILCGVCIQCLKKHQFVEKTERLYAEICLSP